MPLTVVKSEPLTVADQPAFQGLPRDASGRPAVSAATDDGPDPSGSWASQLAAQLEPLAHPKTFADFASILTLPVDEARKAAAIASGLSIGRGPVGDAVTSAGRSLESVGTAIAKPAKYVGLWELLSDPKKAAIMLGGPSAIQATGRLLQKAGAAISGQPAVLSVTEEANLLKQGYSPSMVAKVKESLATQATAPTRAVSANAPAATPSVAPPVAASPAAAPTAAAPAAPLVVAPPVEAAAAMPTPMAKPHLTLDEFQAAHALVKEGHDPADVLAAIARNRLPKAWLNLPTDEDVATAVADRNASGRWPQDGR